MNNVHVNVSNIDSFENKKWWIILMYVGMAITFIYDYFLIAGGLFHIGLVPLDSKFISGEEQAYLIALALEISVLVFYTNLPSFKTFKINSIFSTFLILIFLIVSLFAAMFTLSLRSSGDDYLKKVQSNLETINKKITVVDNTMSGLYTSAIRNHERIARHLIKKDDHGIDICDSACRQQFQKAESLRRQYSFLAVPISDTSEKDLNYAWANIVQRFDMLKDKSRVYIQFSQSEDGKLRIENTLARIQNDINDTGDKYFNSSTALSKKNLTINESYENISSILKFDFRKVQPLTVACFVWGLMPHLLGLFLGLQIRRLKFSNEDLLQERSKAEEEQRIGGEVINFQKNIRLQNLFNNVSAQATRVFDKASTAWTSLVDQVRPGKNSEFKDG